MEQRRSIRLGVVRWHPIYPQPPTRPRAPPPSSGSPPRLGFPIPIPHLRSPACSSIRRPGILDDSNACVWSFSSRGLGVAVLDSGAKGLAGERRGRFWVRSATFCGRPGGSARMMVDAGTTAEPRVAAGALPEAESVEDGGYKSGGWKSDDGRLSCGYSSFRGKRATMEDFYDMKASEIDGQKVCLFGIFDGHGGSRAAEYLKEHLFENLLKHPKFISETKLAISETYKKTDSEFLDAERNTHRDDGSTASTAVLMGKHLYVANVGDSRAIISKGGKAIPLSDDHKPNRSDERKRIENAGGIVMWAGTWRVGGVLAMSRAFGNRLLKQFVVAEPEIQEQQVDDDLELLIVASDGLWDVVANEDAISLARTEEEPEAAARKLTEAAFTRGSADNITCIVVRFNHEKPEVGAAGEGE